MGDAGSSFDLRGVDEGHGGCALCSCHTVHPFDGRGRLLLEEGESRILGLVEECECEHRAASTSPEKGCGDEWPYVAAI